MTAAAWSGVLLGAAGLLLIPLLYWGYFQDRSRGRRRCPKCWYDMTGAPTFVCPECGHEVKRERQFYRTRHRRLATRSAFIVALSLVYLWEVRQRALEPEELGTALQPTIYLLATLPPTSYFGSSALERRFERSGMWPWEEWLLFAQCDRILEQPTATSNVHEAVSLLSIAAKKSPKALDRLVRFAGLSMRPYSDRALEVCAKYCRRLNDNQLASLYAPATQPSWTSRPPPWQYVLWEMIRRDRPEFKELVARWVASRSLEEPGWPDLEGLALLRRLNHQEDPLRILVKSPSVVEGTTADLPTIDVVIQNVDADHTAFELMDWWPGWRFEVRDEHGDVMPNRTHTLFLGGTFGGINFKHGDVHRSQLDMDEFVKALPPGRYQVIVQYHSSCFILEEEDVSGLLVFSSSPFELVVHQDPEGRRPHVPMDMDEMFDRHR